MDRNKVVLVDRQDNPLGEMEKMLAHELGELHRAFSIFIFNDRSELLLQQRAHHKYHGGGLWTNTCCSHPQPGEDIYSAAIDRLRYEMGIQCLLTPVYSFIYHEPVENNLIEHELDHVFIGYSNQQPTINTDEVNDFRWIHPGKVLLDMQSRPSLYTVWFQKALPKLLLRLSN